MGYKKGKEAKKGKCKNAKPGAGSLGRNGKDWLRAHKKVDDVGFKLGAPTLHARWPLFDDAMPVAPSGLWWVLICLALGGLKQ